MSSTLEREILKELRTLYECCLVAGSPNPPKPSWKHTKYLYQMFDWYCFELEKAMSNRKIVLSREEIRLLFDACLKLRDLLKSLEERGKCFEKKGNEGLPVD